MSDFSSSFEQLENNVKLLIKRKKEMQVELDKLQQDKMSMNEQIKSYQEKIEELEEKNKILRIASGSKSGDTREIKLKINEIVREVDKCLAQLNH